MTPVPRRLSPSAVELYLACPYAYYLQYIEGVKSLTAAPMMEGRIMHLTMEKDNLSKVDGGMLSVETLKDFWHDTWSDHQREIDEWVDESEKEIRSRADVLLNRYGQKIQKTLIPRSKEDIERKIEGDVGTVPMVGIVDVVLTDNVLVDYKVKRTVPSEKTTNEGIQLGVYSCLTGTSQVKYVVFLKNRGTIQEVKGHRTEESLTRTKRVVQKVEESIKKGSFPMCPPDHWKCSWKYCGVWYACPQGGKK